jgi:anti-sigma regulatory factor (Ser/Thr protein kinase)
LDDEGARALRTVLLDCLAEAPGAVLVDFGDAAGFGAEAMNAVRDVARLNARWPAALLVICPVSGGREAQLRGAGLATSARLCATRSAARTVADGAPSPRRLRRTMSPTVDAPAEARALVAAVCHEWGHDELADRAQLLVSELVTNAVMHAATEIELTVLLRGDRLSVAVGDHDPRPLTLAEVAVTDRHGRGGLLLDALAASWGQLPRLDGKVVWAIL